MENTNIQEYQYVLERIEWLIQQGSTDEAQKLLDHLFRMKPVRVQWYLVQAKLMLAQKAPLDEILIFMLDKCSFCGPAEGQQAYAEYMLFLMQAAGYSAGFERFMNQFCKMKNYWGTALADEQQLAAQKQQTLQALEAAFCAGDFSEKTVMQLGEAYYTSQNDTAFTVINELLKSLYGKDLLSSKHPVEKMLMVSDNMLLLKELLHREGMQFAGVYNPYTDAVQCQVMVLAAKQLGRETKLVNLAEETLLQACGKDSFTAVLGAGLLLDELGLAVENKKYFERLSKYQSDYTEQNMGFARFGSYLSYLDAVYGIDTRACISRPAACAFSIVIPARNRTDTLQYTLETCLDQDFEDYEVVLSDNSDEGNTAVYELYQRMDDPKLHYYRTPRSLPLQRSFEYAYLMARGAFIISLGADDGVMPWMLRELSDVRRQYPNEEIIMWQAGGYDWPRSQNQSKLNTRNMLYMEKRHQPGSLEIELVPAAKIMQRVEKEADWMYTMPTLYIRSGFKRSYMQTLLEKTGRMWGGLNQDIYTGVVNLCICEHILCVNNILAVVGCSGNSLGCTNVKGVLNAAEKAEFLKIQDNSSMAGRYVLSYMERLLPDVGGKVIYFYEALLYAVSLGLLPEAYAEQMDWQKIYQETARQVDIRDMAYVRKMTELRYAGAKIGEDFLAWFDAEIYSSVSKLCRVDETQALGRKYEEWVNIYGGFLVDAKRLGLFNIADAVQYCVAQSLHPVV